MAHYLMFNILLIFNNNKIIKIFSQLISYLDPWTVKKPFLPICFLFVCLLLIFLSVCVFVCVFVCLIVYLFVYLFVCLFLHFWLIGQIGQQADVALWFIRATQKCESNFWKVFNSSLFHYFSDLKKWISICKTCFTRKRFRNIENIKRNLKSLSILNNFLFPLAKLSML